jgi:hypothetical protein
LPDDFSQLLCVGKQPSQASIADMMLIPKMVCKQHSQAKPIIKDALISADSLKA